TSLLLGRLLCCFLGLLRGLLRRFFRLLGRLFPGSLLGGAFLLGRRRSFARGGSGRRFLFFLFRLFLDDDFFDLYHLAGLLSLFFLFLELRQLVVLIVAHFSVEHLVPPYRLGNLPENSSPHLSGVKELCQAIVSFAGI